MSGQSPITAPGLERIKKELDHLIKVEREDLKKVISEARELGDLKENAEYHAQRENQGLMQARINQLRSKLARAHIVDTATLPKDEIVFGATVKVRDMDYADVEEFTLVGDGDEDYDTGKILATSPIGSALLGKKKGDQVSIPIPRGTLRYEILDIEFRD